MGVLAALGAFFGLDTADEPERFISLGGLVVNVFICWLFSAHRRKVRFLDLGHQCFSSTIILTGQQ